MLKNLKTIKYLIILIVFPTFVYANNSEFNIWIIDFKTKAISFGVSKNAAQKSKTDIDKAIATKTFLLSIFTFLLR